MTPPDSGDKLRKCDCGLVNLSYSDTINADGAMHTTAGCNPIRTPDSGEREVRSFGFGDKCDRCPLTIVSACLPCSFGGCAVHMAEHLKACPDEIVAVPMPLARRILAALERAAVYEPTLRDDYAEIADELRAAVERKS